MVRIVSLTARAWGGLPAVMATVAVWPGGWGSRLQESAGPAYEVELFAGGRIGEQHEQAGAVGRPERRDLLIAGHLERR